MILRLATENDYESVHQLMYQIFELHLLRRPDIYKDGDPYTLERYRKTLLNKDELMILAENERGVVGLCHMAKQEFIDHPILRPGCSAFIEDFCVDKDCHRQGIGRALYGEAIKRAEEWKANSLELNVWEVNEEARKFYDAIGLKPKSTRMEIRL